jgi:integrase/recombinase XerD
MSALAQAADDYLRLRRALGHKLDDAGRLLPRFVAYLDSIGASTVTIQAALAWALQADAPSGSTVWATRLTIARGFARHLAGIDPRTEVPPAGLLSCRRHRRIPYLYSPADIAALRALARDNIPSALRAATFDTLIGLLAVTGMRIGEVIALDRSDVNWSEGVVLVRESKFATSRLVPLHPSTTTALADYADLRDRLQPAPTTSAFFCSVAGTRLHYSDVSHTFRKLADGAGIAPGATARPRLHDLRHSFAVRTLLDWYRSGQDVQARLAWLSTYLGHREPRYTYWYLSATPELLAVAARRLEDAGEATR